MAAVERWYTGPFPVCPMITLHLRLLLRNIFDLLFLHSCRSKTGSLFSQKSPNKCQKRVNYPFSFLLTLVPSQSPIYSSICAHLSIRIKSFFLHTVSHQKLLSVYPQKIPFSFIVQLTLGAYPRISSSPSLVLRCPPFCSHSLYYPSVLWTV